MPGDLGIGHPMGSAQQKHLLALRRQGFDHLEQQVEILAREDRALGGRVLRD